MIAEPPAKVRWSPASRESIIEIPIVFADSASDPGEVWDQYREEGPGGPAESRLVEMHLELVDVVVGRVALALPAHVDRDDLRSVGVVGLLHALRAFDNTRGATFTTYARVRIRGAILDELRRIDWVPRSIHEKSRRLQEVMERLEAELGSVPSEEEMARAMNLSLADYRDLLTEIRPATFVSIDSVRSVAGEEGFLHGEVLADPNGITPDNATAMRERAGLLAMRIQRLPDMQRKVLALYYYEDLTLREIAEVFGISESRVCQIHGQAILALKATFKKDDRTVNLEFRCLRHAPGLN
jgi:RNA polymerase sigma factor for flagellar operon FliA